MRLLSQINTFLHVCHIKLTKTKICHKLSKLPFTEEVGIWILKNAPERVLGVGRAFFIAKKWALNVPFYAPMSIISCLAFTIERAILRYGAVMNFRYDINGLRAIAVIAVVLYHFNPAWVPGGFAGVDVFFVISGFLMTGIIFRGLESNNFKLFKFYVARANRIVPALSMLCLATLIFGWLYLPPIDFRDIGKHAASSMLFWSNFTYWQESGYFDVASNEKWLLHTWSLSVEWQFYIIYPILLMVLKRFLSLESLKRLIVAGTILGFIFSVIATIKWPNPAYYLLPARAWEMMMGGIAFLYPLSLSFRTSKILGRLGVALIFTACFLLSSDNAWPGHLSIVPVLGAYLYIISNQKDDLICRNRYIQKIGTDSYTIYLWHWPLVVGFNLYSSGNWTFSYIGVALFLGICFSFLDNKLRKAAICTPAYTTALLTSLFVFHTNGVLERVPKEYQVTRKQFRNQNEGHVHLRRGKDPVYINSTEEDFEYIVVGNSYARHYYSFFISSGLKVASLAVDGCLSTRRNYTHFSKSKVCEGRYEYLLNFVKIHPKKMLIFSSSWEGYTCKTRREGFNCNSDESVFIDEMRALMDDVSKYVDTVYIVGKTQGSDIIPFRYLTESYLPGYYFFRKSGTENKTQTIKKIKVNAQLSAMSKSMGFVYIDPTKALCFDEECYVIKDNTPIYTDHGHLTKFGANIVGQHIMNEIKESRHSR